MSRATVVYIVMLVVGVGGLWLILRVGSGLTAPADISGVWGVGGEDPASPRVLGQTVHVEQSGHYLRLSFENGLRVDVKLLSESRPDPDGVGGLDLRFKGPAWSLSALGTGANGPLIFRLDGLEKHVFTATRLPTATDEEDIAAAAPDPPPAAPTAPAALPAVATTDADANPDAHAP